MAFESPFCIEKFIHLNIVLLLSKNALLISCFFICTTIPGHPRIGSPVQFQAVPEGLFQQRTVPERDTGAAIVTQKFKRAVNTGRPPVSAAVFGIGVRAALYFGAA